MTGPDPDDALRRYGTEARHDSFHTGRYRCRYVLWGQGPPLVFVHGLTDRAASFSRVMARLADRFTCVGFELADGQGDEAAVGTIRHRHHAEDTIRLLDHLGYGHTDLLGSSYGSTVAIRVLGTYPDRVRRGILQGGFARRPLRWFERGPARLARYWPGLVGGVPGRHFVLSRLDGPQFATALPEVKHHFLTCTGRTPIRALCRRTLFLDRLDLRPWLPDIPQPVLMIGGAEDRIVPLQYQAELEAGLRNVRRVEISGCGHYPQYTHPGAMADAIRTFLLS
jgi:pimeloyl-ACP methyl ester carboxylesterase